MLTLGQEHNGAIRISLLERAYPFFAPLKARSRLLASGFSLCQDAVQQAKSGHPGTPMALAPLAYTIWQNFLRFDPNDPIWPNRDRFVLSNGHASMLLYAMLHLTGVKAVNAKYERLGEA